MRIKTDKSGNLGNLKICGTCSNRWYGNSAHPNFAQWFCKNGKTLVLIGERGSDAELKSAKGCGRWKN